jgi:hypothetical protein
MKKLFLTLSLSVAFSATQAQLDLPQPSPKAIIKQTVGLTDITIDYSSPAVKGRTVWGDLVPYGQLWRTGANMATKVTFSKDVIINGKNITAGSYSLLSIPDKDMWTVMLNKDSELRGLSGYAQEKDVVSMRVKPQSVSHRERLTFLVTDYTNDGGNISMEWEKVKIDIPFTINTDDHAMKNISSTLNAAWRNYANAARYLLENKKDSEMALNYINNAIALNSNSWYNHWIKAQILAERNNFKEALISAQKAKEIGDKDLENFWWKEEVETALTSWKGKK